MTRHLLVIGAQRCGTTYLTALLDAHPQVAMARPARPEPKVFLSDELADRGADWYRRTYFAHADGELLLGEKSTSYLEDPRAPERAARVLGDVHVIAMLRDPVERAVSNWRLSTDHGFESRPLEQALWDNLAEARPWDAGQTSVSPFAYLERGRYDHYLQPWVDRFGAAVHVFFLSELKSADASLERVYGSIGVDPSFRPDLLGERVNEGHEPVPALSAELLGRLRDYFADSDRALAERLGRRPPWSANVVNAGGAFR